MDNINYLNLELKQLEADNENHVFEGYAAIFNNKDYGNDVILPGAFKDSLAGDTEVKLFWMHDDKHPIGMPKELKEDSKGLLIKGAMPKEDIFVKQRVMPQMRIGSLEMSIGYKIIDQDFKDNVKYIKSVWLLEASLVGLGMNNKAQILNYKSLDMIKIKDLNERDMELMFKNGFKASNTVAKHLVSLIKADSQRDVDSSDQREVEMMRSIRYKSMIDNMKRIKNNK